MNELLNSIDFYLDNEIDEVIVEESQNHFLIKNEEIEVKNYQLENKELEVKEKFTQNKKDDFSHKVEDKKSSGEIKNISSTSEAISNLAKRAKIEPSDKFMSIDLIVEKAREAAAKCDNLDDLREAVEEFDGCGLKKMATNTVFCDGNPDSKIMVIGEAPGNHEDLEGIPFCGDSGKLLDNMFSAINMTRDKDFYLTNVIFWRPPGNRRPTQEELKICRPFVERHIRLVDPKMIILVGSTAMSAILGIEDSISKVRGEVISHKFEFMDREVDSFVIFHPSYLMRQSLKKKIAWGDMLKLEGELGG